jgi:PAS domain S-box-containing protein
VAAIFSDITERRRTAIELARLAEIVENSHDAIVGCSLDSAIINWNRGAEALFGHTAKEAVGQNLSILTPLDQLNERLTLAELAQAAAERTRTQAPGRIIHVDAPEAGISGAWDGDRLGQILDNLLGNAISTQPTRGRWLSA